MKIKHCFFSIITVVLNAKSDLEKTIKSLEDQSFKNFEFIVVDGGSTDGTVELIKKNSHIIDYWVSEKDKGIYDAMNKGLKISSGKYIGMLNAGDQYTPNALQIINKYLTSRNFDFIFGTVKKKVLKYGFRKSRIFWNFDFATSHSSGFFINKQSQNILGEYNLKYKISSDYDLFYRMIVTKKMKGCSTDKNELIGIFKSGTSYSSKFSFIDHLMEETKIRLDNKQNRFFVLMVFLRHFYKNKDKTNESLMGILNKFISL